MAVSGVGATPEPQRNLSQNVNEQDENLYSIFDYDKNGTVSTEEQKKAFLDMINEQAKLADLYKELNIDPSEFFDSFAGNFAEIETKERKDLALLADNEVRSRISKLGIQFTNTVFEEYNEEKE